MLVTFCVSICVNSRFEPCIVASPPPPTCHHRLFWLSLSARPFAKPNAENDPSGTNKEIGDDDKTRIDLGGGGSHGWFAKETVWRVGESLWPSIAMLPSLLKLVGAQALKTNLEAT